MDGKGLIAERASRAARGFPITSSDPLVDWIVRHGHEFSAERLQDLNDFSSSPSLFLIRDGWVLRSRAVREAERATVATYIPGDIVNLACVVEPVSSDALVAHTAVRAVSAPCRGLQQAIESDPALSFSLMRRFLADSAWLREALAAVGQLAAKDRLLFYVAQTRQRMITYGALHSDATRFELPLTQEALASTIGVTPVHISRIVKQHRTEGVMLLGGGVVSIPDIERFERQVAKGIGFPAAGDRSAHSY